ncbi:MAG: hypothetical protein FWG88_07015 [Oscillospiraceae bacterium]|nr:hypothetical protein [Oscillospiraceae bacterium]
MEFYAKLDKQRETDPKELIEALNELKSSVLEAAQEAREAERAYYNSANEAANNVSDRIVQLENQSKKIEKSIKELSVPFVKANAELDNEAIANIQNSKKTLESELLQVNDEISLLKGASVTGADALYDACVEKNNLYIERVKSFTEAKEALHKLATEFEESFEKIKETTYSWLGDEARYGLDLKKLKAYHFADSVSALKNNQAETKAADEATALAESARSVYTPRTAYPQFMEIGNDKKFFTT